MKTLTERKKNIKNCAVVDTAHANDIALIRLPNDFDCKLALPMHKGNIKDGDEVFSAGFPAIGDKPVWQFAKGIVSNARISMADLGYPDTVMAIQHTAAIDGGSSGGPLLVKKGNDYEIVGMNTWSARRRQSTNLSLFAKDVKEFADRTDLSAKTTSANTSVESLEKKVEKFFDAFKKRSYSDMQSYLADSIALSINSGFFTNNANELTTYETNELRSGDPMNGLRSMCARSISNTFLDPASCVVTSVEAKNGVGVVSIKNKKGVVTNLKWKQDKGEWKLADTNGLNFSTEKVRKKGKNGSTQKAVTDHTGDNFYVETSNDLNNSCEIGYGFGLSDNAINRIKFEWTRYIIPYVFWGLGFQKAKDEYLFYNEDEYYEHYSEKDFKNISTFKKQVNMLGIDAHFGVTCPMIVIEKLRFMPYAKLSVGTNINFKDEIDSNFYRGIYGGLKAGYILPSENCVYISGEYRYRKTNATIDDFPFNIAIDENDPNMNKFKSFVISLGIIY